MMLRDWYSALELSEMKLVGMPTTKKGFLQLAARENWPSRKRAGKGGGLEYQPPKKVLDAIKSLAVDAAVTSVKHEVEPVKPATDLTLKTDTTQLKDWQRNTAEARAAIVNEVKRLAAVLGTDKAIMKMVDLAAQGELQAHIQQMVIVANAKSGTEGKRTLSRRSIYRWIKDAENGINSLAPKACENNDLPAWSPYLLAIYGQPQKPSLAYCIEKLAKTLPAGIDCPSYSAANRLIKKMSNIDSQKGRMGNREIKNIKPFVRRDTSQMWPTDCYTSDGHTFDAEVAHPAHSKAFKPEITTVLDIATRKCVGFSTGLAESTWTVLDALRHACLTHGIPSIFYVDNGSGFKNDLMSNEVTGFMARLNITPTHSIAYNSQARGIEERSHQTIWVRGSKELSTYMGADMDKQAKEQSYKVTRKEIALTGTSKRLMPWQAFIGWCEEQINEYNNKPHRGLPKIYDEHGKKRHQTPNEAWAQAVAEGFKQVDVEQHEADDLFRPYKEAVTRRGEITLFTNTYFSQDLAPFHGEKMRVGYDIHDPSKVWVRNQAGQLVCVAEFEANKRSYFPVSFIQQAAENRAKGRIKRAQAKVDEAELELYGNEKLVEEARLEITNSAIQMPQEIQHVMPETSLAANVLALKITPARPFFETDAAKYRWLSANASALTEQDEAWLNYYKLTDEFQDLFDDRELAIR